MSKIRNLILLIVAIALGTVDSTVSHASPLIETGNAVTLTVRKVGYADGATVEPVEENIDDPFLSSLKDSNGNPLVNIEGVTFRITKVEPTNPDKSIKLDVRGTYNYASPFYQKEVVTDVKGKAFFGLSSGITQGSYIVEELPNDKTQEVMKPMLVKLPYQNSTNDGWEYDLTIYPKSGLIPPKNEEKEPVKPKEEPMKEVKDPKVTPVVKNNFPYTTSESPMNFKQTAKEFLSPTFIILFLMGVIFSTLVILMYNKRKSNN